MNTAIEENGQAKRVSGIMCALAHVHPSGGGLTVRGGQNVPGFSPFYNTATAPTNIASETKHAVSTAAVFGRRARTAPEDDPKVATNWAVGFGPPEMVTVGLEGIGWAEELPLPEPESTTENICEVPYMMPCVLLRKRRK